jgi:hypothetical protein
MDCLLKRIKEYKGAKMMQMYETVTCKNTKGISIENCKQTVSIVPFEFDR